MILRVGRICESGSSNRAPTQARALTKGSNCRVLSSFCEPDLAGQSRYVLEMQPSRTWIRGRTIKKKCP